MCLELWKRSRPGCSEVKRHGSQFHLLNFGNFIFILVQQTLFCIAEESYFRFNFGLTALGLLLSPLRNECTVLLLVTSFKANGDFWGIKWII